MPSITINENKLLILLQELIRIESVNPELISGGSGEKQISSYLKNYLEKLGLKTIVQKVSKNRSNIIGIMKGSGDGKSLILNGHMDTVGISGMEISPLKADLKNGNVYGRGSADMKSGIAAMLSACESILVNHIYLKGDVLLTFVVDEEFKSIGTERLLESFTAQAAIVCEPTDLKIGLAHKGFVWANVDVFGKAAHGSRPEEGIDAIIKAGKILSEIEKLDKKKLAGKSHPLLRYPSVHASVIKGGRELSTYPDFCRIQMERRTIPGEDANTFEEELNELINKVKMAASEFNAKSKIFFHRLPLETSKKESIVKSLNRSIKMVLNQRADFSGISWWMDSALISEAGI
ncbi:MAG: ArgE/DapE family deacylase, partial [Candidatus Aminicenantes bacterium]|nr:ArgE/DapE family deacylase [Candidatus Aminicenantes bacterium]